MNDAVNSTPVRIARQVVETFVKTGRPPEVTDVGKLDIPLPPDNRAACFVSLHRHGDLRGCIGTILPTMTSVTAEIIRNAVSACSEDPRFDPVAPDELEGLEISVDILGAPETAETADDLDPKKYGVIVTSGFRRGLLLPDLEGVDTVTQQLAIACRKGGIGLDEPFTMQRFTVTRYH